MRDTYRRERKKEKEKSRSGAGASQTRPWRYSQIMSFLNPFMEERATSSNMPGRVEGASQAEAGSQGQEGEGAGEAAATPTTGQEGAPCSEDEEIILNLEPIFLEPIPEPTPSTSEDRPRAQKRASDGRSVFEKKLIGAMDAVMAKAGPCDPDELFLKSLLPDIKALSARRKAEVKFKIHQMIFETTCRQAEEDEGQGTGL